MSTISRELDRNQQSEGTTAITRSETPGFTDPVSDPDPLVHAYKACRHHRRRRWKYCGLGGLGAPTFRSPVVDPNLPGRFPAACSRFHQRKAGHPLNGLEGHRSAQLSTSPERHPQGFT
ncbi:hypothetical protein M8542_30250 [Amycolatopsis sp. OK19-0408]|uniref:Uncharacterized protein n=1 Tax=Amycolatopsis iheyensis TaxID=2945988 RepID=A0A9X2SP53_9PSEU|nr:hypothetical protein [Amycolatopsis iheyensis]MCR6487120.1 hypothetical protein [Amycolatopsis iheyensis]